MICFQGQLIPLPQTNSHIDFIKGNSNKWYLYTVQFCYHFLYYSSLQNKQLYYCTQNIKTTSYIQHVPMRVLNGENYILYETYDCVLQYVQFTANSHNLQTNIKLKIIDLNNEL